MAWIDSGNIVKNLVLRIAGEKYHSFALITFAWQNVVGDILAERSIPLKLEFDVLFVKVTSPVWLQELLLNKQLLLDALNQRLSVPLRDIVFLSASEQRKRPFRKRDK